MKIPFDIKYKPEIQTGKYKVVTKIGVPVEIVHWDLTMRKNPILAVISFFGGKMDHRYGRSGKYYGDFISDDKDLFILTDEPILTEFEQAVLDLVDHLMKGDYVYPQRGSRDEEKGYDDLQRVSSELLAVARKTIAERGESTGKQATENMIIPHNNQINTQSNE